MAPPEKELAPNAADMLMQALPPQKDKVGLLVTNELDKAIERCKRKVDAISKDCRKRNRKFRDLQFDLEEDRERCLHGLETPAAARSTPDDVLRVSQIFEKPEFYIDGVSVGDIVQGELGNCWFLSALATMSTMPSLVENFCVARDEKVGVYGFIFHRESGWVDVVIDDLLFVSVPKYESLSSKEKNLYHNDKNLYEKTARKGGKCLYFARSGTDNETWVALVEKAYAKLHGDYAALVNGAAAEALEDLTGGVSTLIHMNDILDPDVFWETELLRANKDRSFGCYLAPIPAPSDMDDGAVPTVNGLITGHAYSVLKAIEHKGKRFVRVRNPWGQSEWTGPWSDGSKEWTSEWLAVIDQLEHSFGEDGEFLMAYEDFLSAFWVVHRTVLFDSSWTLSSHWLEVMARKFPGAWNYGDVSFTFNMPKASSAIIVLAQLDTRYFKEISGYTRWSFDFALFKRGEKEALAFSHHAAIWTRSVNVEMELEAGDYVVHVRFDRRMERDKDYFTENVGKWNPRKLGKVMMEACYSQSVAANFNPNDWGHHQLPIPLERYAGFDLSELEVRAMVAAANAPSHGDEPSEEPGAVPSLAQVDTGVDKVPEGPGIADIVSDGMETKENEGGESIVVGVPISQEEGHEAIVEAQSKLQSDDPHAETRRVFETGRSEEDGAASATSEDGADGSDEGVQPDDVQIKDTTNEDGPETNGMGDEQAGADSDGEPPLEHVPLMRPPRLQSEGDEPIRTTLPTPPPRPRMRLRPEHEGISCDGCKSDTIVGIRFKCIDALCPNFDLCEECFSRGFENDVHKRTHKMLPMAIPTDAMKLQDPVVPGDDNSVIVGLRVFAKDCKETPVTVEGQLRHGRIISWRRPDADS